MVTKVDIHDIAKYTILRLIQNGDSVCPLKLQKILYYMQAWHMVYFGKDNTLFEDIPQAWVNGPVYRTIYDTYKHIPMYNQFSLSDIDITINDDIEKILTYEARNLHDKLPLTQEQFDFIESIYSHYGAMEHDRLVFLTHSESPWSEQREGLLPFEHSEKEIPLNAMFEYYNQRMLRNRAKEQ